MRISSPFGNQGPRSLEAGEQNTAGRPVVAPPALLWPGLVPPEGFVSSDASVSMTSDGAGHSLGASAGFSRTVSPALASLLGASAGAPSLTGTHDEVAVAVADRLARDLKWHGKKSNVAKLLEQVTPEQMRDVELEFFARRFEPLRHAIADGLMGARQREALAVYDARACATDEGGTCPKTKVSQLLKKGYVEEAELVTHYGYRTNNDIELYVQGKNAFPKVFEAIDAAEHHVHVCYYIFANDDIGRQFKDKLIAAARRGCEVRVSMDGIGSMLMIPGSPTRRLIKELTDAGVKVQRNHMMDLKRSQQMWNHPDHRKMVIVDGKVGFTGGMNVANHYVDQYHDLMIRVRGDAVKQMQSEFIQHWLHLGSSFDANPDDLEAYFPKLSRAPGAIRSKVSQHIPGEHREIMKTYMERIATAEKHIYIENPYCTNPRIQTALIEAAKRGVEVHVILPADSDHGFSHAAARQRYPEMIEAGVNIYEYPGFNHGKVMMVDDKFVTFGSSNLDDVALYHIYEMNLDIEDEGFAATIKKDIFDVDLRKSKQMAASDVTRWQKISGSFFRLFAHWI